MMSGKRYLAAVVLIATAFLFLANWNCSNDSFAAASHDKGQSLGTENCSPDFLPQELISSGSIQVPEDHSSYPSFKQSYPSGQIAKLQFEERPSLRLTLSRPESKISTVQAYILNSSYLL